MNFRNYYAYDDGSPEYGFGISGESTAGALLACRFRVYQPDTLRALQMLFNKTRNHANADLGFQLCVWKDEGGLPGELLYMSPETFTPGDEFNFLGFNTYRISGGCKSGDNRYVFFCRLETVYRRIHEPGI